MNPKCDHCRCKTPAKECCYCGPAPEDFQVQLRIALIEQHKAVDNIYCVGRPPELPHQNCEVCDLIKITETITAASEGSK